jgi:predicted alpha/beta-hydrolase family hydrolase
MLCAEDGGVAAGLLLFSYPLHAPQTPEKKRTEHLPRLRVPALFVHGTRDPFGTPDEMKAAMRLIPSPTSLLLVEGAGHSLAPPRAAGISLDNVAASILQAFRELTGG